MPPFWINMPLLFELYVLQLLKRKYGDVIAYHITSRGNEIDYGKRDEKIIIDAKYIPAWSTSVDHDNVRQLSGYARNISIRYKLIGQIDTTTILPCIIIYPDIDNGLLYLPDNPVEDGTDLHTPVYSASESDAPQSSQVVGLPVVLTKLPSYSTFTRVYDSRLWLILGSAKACFAGRTF